MRIAIVPNAFKGSRTAAQAADCIAWGLRRALPRAALVKIPMADGGDGILPAIIGATGGSLVNCTVRDRREIGFIT